MELFTPITVVGSNTPLGSKIVRCLRSNNVEVYGIDRLEQDEGNKANKFFKIDLRNKDALRFFFEVTNPKTIIFCGQHLSDRVEFIAVDYNYQIFLNMMTFAMDKNIKNLIVVSNYGKDFPTNPAEISWYAIEMLTDIFTKVFNLNTILIKSQDNLYKNIKSYLGLKTDYKIGKEVEKNG